MAQSILNRIDGTEQEPEPYGVAVSEALEQQPSSASVCVRETEQNLSEREPKRVLSEAGTKQQNFVKGSQENKGEELGESEKEEALLVAVAAAACSSSGSSNEMIPSCVSGGWAAAAINKARTINTHLSSPQSRCKGGSVLDASVVSVFGDCSCLRFSGNSSSSPHHTVIHETLHTIAPVTNAEGLCGTTDDLPRERRAGPL